MASKPSRAIRRVSWVVVFAAAVAAGMWSSAALAPERVRREAERALSALLGDARVGSVALGWSRGPALVASAIEVVEGDQMVALVDRAELGLDLLRLFRGEGRFDRLIVSGASLRLRRGDDGAWRPRAIAALADTSSPGAARADAPRGDFRFIAIREGRVLLERETGRDVEIVGIELRVTRRPSLQLELRGAVDDAPFSVVAKGGVDRLDFQGSVSGIPLDRLRGWGWRGAHALEPFEGDLALRVRGVAGPEAVQVDHLEAQLGAATLRGQPLPALRVAGAAAIGPERIELAGVQLNADAWVVHIDGSLPRSTEPDALFEGSLRTQRIELDALLDHADTLGLEAARSALVRIESGVIEALGVRATALSRRSLQRWAAGADPWPEGLEVSASFQELAIPLAGGDAIRQLGGEVELDAEQLALRGVHALLGERPLPGLELEVEGWSRLVRNGESRSDEAMAAVPPLRGREALVRFLDPESDDRPPGWESARLEFDWIDHPALLRPLERAAAQLRPLQPGIGVDLHGARWGGVWVSGRGRLLERADREVIELHLKTHGSAPANLGDRVDSVVRNAPMPRDRSGWAAGRAEVALRKLARFDATRVAFSFGAEGTRVGSDDVDLSLAPTGTVQGLLELELGEAGTVPYRAQFQLSGGDLAAFLEDLGATDAATDGSLVLAADLRGRLRPGESMLTSLRGPLSVHARDGVVRRRVPWALAIAAASETFNPFRSRDTLPYDAIDGNFVLEAGRLEAQSVTVTGPTLRLLATGALHFETPNRLEAVVGLFFFRGIDKVIGSVPILNTLLLGSDENLVPAYFAFEGPWEAPEARLIPVKTLFAGPASFVVEGVPGFVRGGLERLGRVFSPRPRRKPDPPAARSAP